MYVHTLQSLTVQFHQGPTNTTLQLLYQRKLDLPPRIRHRLGRVKVANSRCYRLLWLFVAFPWNGSGWTVGKPRDNQPLWEKPRGSRFASDYYVLSWVKIMSKKVIRIKKGKKERSLTRPNRDILFMFQDVFSLHHSCIFRQWIHSLYQR